MLSIVEKVILLQEVDVFQFASTDDLSQIAAIAEEVNFKPGEVIYKEGGVPDSMYLIIAGNVKLERQGEEVMTVTDKDVFGTWALFDDEPRVVTATALEDVRLMRIEKEEFYEILADNVKITEGILKFITRRMRRLVERVEHESHAVNR